MAGIRKRMAAMDACREEKTMRDFTRREFVWAGSVLAGFAASLLVPGGRTLSVGKANAAGVDFPESSCNSRDKAGKKILVAYARGY